MNNNLETNHVSEVLEHDNGVSNVAVISTKDSNEGIFTDQVIEENDVKISLFPSKRKTVKKVNVVIEGKCNIENAQLIKENCQKLLQYFDLVSITLKNIVDIDLAAIQLLHVLNTSTSFMQKTITIESELSKDDKALIVSAGLMDIISKRK